MVDMGRSSSRWAVPTLHRWIQVVDKSKLREPLETRQRAAFLYGLGFRSAWLLSMRDCDFECVRPISPCPIRLSETPISRK